MKRIWFPPVILFPLITLISIFTFLILSTSTVVQAQQPTVTPTNQASSTGMFITVITEEPQINVRMGPSSSVYPIVGSLLKGATAPALGRSPGGDWIQIEYIGVPYDRGWVYSPLVQVSPGTLNVMEPPPTPVSPATATIDPTLAAQFIIVPTNTRLPTFTPPPSLIVPMYTQMPVARSEGSIPLGIIIIAFAVLGVIGYLLSLVFRR